MSAPTRSAHRYGSRLADDLPAGRSDRPGHCRHCSPTCGGPTWTDCRAHYSADESATWDAGHCKMCAAADAAAAAILAEADTQLDPAVRDAYRRCADIVRGAA